MQYNDRDGRLDTLLSYVTVSYGPARPVGGIVLQSMDLSCNIQQGGEQCRQHNALS